MVSSKKKFVGSTLLKRETFSTKRARPIPVRLAGYREFGPLWTTTWGPVLGPARDWDFGDVDRTPADAFLEEIEPMLESSRRREITVFVHGFNTTFAGNTEVAAEFWHYYRDGVMMSFEWPSEGSMFAYDVDTANAEFAVRQFRLLLQFLAERTSAERRCKGRTSAGRARWPPRAGPNPSKP